MKLRLYNTLKREKEDFEPLRPGHVGMYVCGPTVYDYAHIGNARPVVVFDVLYRLLKLLYGDVVYVRNITDVDDKINAASRESGESIGVITERTTRAFHEDMAALETLNPDQEPRATDHIPEMIALTEALLKGGHAYEAEGHVLFDVLSWDDYGGLSRNRRDDIIAGARIEVAPYKKDAADFVLWKPSENGLPGWDTPWGRCRPGWHLECSAMSSKYLGKTFDIHGGGQDLIFPHHENEIAQSVCAHAQPLARYWLHNGYLMAEGEKMSKSLGNFYTVHELLEEFPGEAIRLALLKTHYRKPLDFTKAGIEEAKRELDKLYIALRNAAEAEAEQVETPSELIEALNDDINTPLALSHLHEMAGLLNMAGDDKSKAFAKGRLLSAAASLGLLQQDPEEWFRWQPKDAESLGETEIEALIAKREEARANKDFALSDRIRGQLAEKGIVLEDGPQGTTWRRG